MPVRPSPRPGRPVKAPRSRSAVRLAFLLGALAACSGGGGDGGGAQAVCGDGTVEGTEACDDGNLVDGDGCDSSCTPSDCTGDALATFEGDLVPSREVHVATGGDDVSGDGSAASPFATIERAASEATPGTAIRVHAGTYAGGQFLDGVAGLPGAPVWIGGAPGEAPPVLQGGAEGLHLSRVRYLILHDLEVAGATANGVNCDDGGEVANPEATHHVVFRNLFLHDVGSTGNQDCLKLSGVNDYHVLDSVITRCGDGGSGIDQVGCHRGVIARNVLRDVGVVSGNGIQAKGGSADVDIRWNRIANAGPRALNLGGSTGFEFFRPPLSETAPNAEARNLRALANVIEGPGAPVAFVGCVGCVAAHNTLVDPSPWVIRILQETTTSAPYQFLPASDGEFVNNLVWFERAALSTDVNVGPGTSPGTFVFSNDLWYAHDDPGQSEPALPVAETAAIVGQDPLFVDAASGDFRLAAGTPAAGRGAPAGVPGDAAGACYATPPTIGAYEIVP